MRPKKDRDVQGLFVSYGTDLLERARELVRCRTQQRLSSLPRKATTGKYLLRDEGVLRRASRQQAPVGQ